MEHRSTVRVAIKNHGISDGKVHYITRDGEVMSDITKDGLLTAWVDDVFDTWDNALTELL